MTSDLWPSKTCLPTYPQIEHDPRMPAYIATQGPLSHTISDFWQVSETPRETRPVLKATVENCQTSWL